ncbi:MAG: FkbM family methyltransferase [Pyrinomonadaceae bacterium]|nr:FkbM family methyltransferase [Pyrinomonadaceae bacterium]
MMNNGEPKMKFAPAWVRATAAVVRYLPAGRYRLMNQICRRPPEAFLMKMPEEFGGVIFKCDLHDAISREVCFTGRYEPQETMLVQAILRPGMTFVDVGANWGYFTFLAAHLVGKSGRVISVEPDPRLFKALQESIERNDLEQVAAVQVAAGSGSGVLNLAGYDDAGSNFGVSRVISKEHTDEKVFAVASRPLDELIDEANLSVIDLLKMDIEGYEGFALMGMARTLKERRVKRILLELHPAQLAEHGQSAAEIIEQLRGFGYCAWRLNHSPQVTRHAAYSKHIDLKTFLQPFDEGQPLDVWSHLLWTAPDVELQW